VETDTHTDKQTDTHTHTQTHKPSTVSLAAHARRGLTSSMVDQKMIDINGRSNVTTAGIICSSFILQSFPPHLVYWHKVEGQCCSKISTAAVSKCHCKR